MPSSRFDELTEQARRIRLVIFDFDGVFTDNAVYVLEDGREFVRCSRADGIGLRKLEKLSIQTLVLSTETNPVVSARCRKLKIECLQAQVDKRATLEMLARERSLTLSEVAYVGNDINDASCLRAVGLPIVVEDAVSEVVPLARWRTSARGGYGAVREVCDWFARILDPDGSLTSVYP